MEKPSVHPYLVLVIGVVALSTSAIFVKLASAPPAIIATYRLAFSALLTLPFVLIQRNTLKELLHLTGKQMLAIVLAGGFLAVHFLLWFESLRFTSVASSTVLVTLQPLFAFIGGFFLFRERISALPLAGCLLALLGSFVIGWGDFQIGGIALWGDVLALLGAATVTGYWLIGQYIRQSLSLPAYTFVVYTVTALLLFLYDLCLGIPLTGYRSADWLWFFSLAFIPTLLGHSLLNWVIKWLNTTTISMSILGEPVGTAILAYLILGENITIAQSIGGAVMLLGIFLFIRYQKPLDKGVQTDEPISESK
ncbi:DMT family transporter [Brevibacillus fulvus]|uniref:Drug/metabolite transporter (DMT)-like permease n=1 Tax=Brevibacillus fulvus TaxID=1125967 RepID=A0A938Y5M8_9BACL|nr:DMT family transporter [Brevibacillus fulvus]MBM7591700.1 drug/metabolite transporter (DMT)-like permease [Brevibacillus fulvus]